MNQKASNRNGLATICVLVCLTVVLSLSLAIHRQTIRAQRELKLHRQMLQTEWLLQAGVQRAAIQLEQSPDYDGETWTPNVLNSGELSSQVLIRRSTESDSNIPILEITARIGQPETQSNNAVATQRSLRFVFNPPSQEKVTP